MKYFFKVQKMHALNHYVFEEEAWLATINMLKTYLHPMDMNEFSAQLQEACRTFFKICVIESSHEIFVPSAVLHCALHHYCVHAKATKELEKILGELWNQWRLSTDIESTLKNHSYRVIHPSYTNMLSCVRTHAAHSSMFALDEYIAVEHEPLKVSGVRKQSSADDNSHRGQPRASQNSERTDNDNDNETILYPSYDM